MMKIFYSWQSDHNGKFCRNFIKDSLIRAIKNINSTLGIVDPDREVRLDHDTKDIPGIPDIANTIFEKIRDSEIFIADITFVGQNNLRKISNPNVLIELGYALSVLGSDRVICVMNTVHGTADELPFDLKHKRHPIQYRYDETINIDSIAKSNFVKSLETAIMPILSLGSRSLNIKNISVNPSIKDIYDTILNSDSRSDWQKNSFGAAGHHITAYYKYDVNLRIEVNYLEDSHNENFKELWANKHPNPHASSDWFTIYYISTIIKRVILVSVDGGRATLPLPKIGTKEVVDLLSYKIAQIFDTLGTMDEYIIRSGLSLTSEKVLAP